MFFAVKNLEGYILGGFADIAGADRAIRQIIRSSGDTELTPYEVVDQETGIVVRRIEKVRQGYHWKAKRTYPLEHKPAKAEPERGA